MGKYANLTRGGTSVINEEDIMSEIDCSALSQDIKFEVMISALKIDFNSIIEPIIRGTNLNGYLTSNEIIEKINLKSFIAKDDNAIVNNGRVLSKILYTELIRLQLQWRRFSPTDPMPSIEEQRLKLDGICFKILKICK